MTPSSAFLAEMYLKASQQAAEAERSFSLQNIIISDLRIGVSTDNLSKKSFITKVSKLLTKEVIESLIQEATNNFVADKTRRSGAGHI